MTTNFIGKPLSRVDGIKKVTGDATYVAEFDLDNLSHGYVVESTIASGKITSIDTSIAASIAGVTKVFTHENIPKSVNVNADYNDMLSPPGHPFRPLYNDEILYNGQPIALVIADTFELARYAAGLVTVTYEEEKYSTILADNLAKATNENVDAPPSNRGDVASAYADAPHKIESEYHTPRHYHNPMEPHATIADWNVEKESFLIYDKIQGVVNSQKYVCGVFGLEKSKVRIVAPFIGGGFGSGLRPQYQLFMAAMASRALECPVKVVLTRRQMFSFGHRPANIQRLKLSANTEGELTSIEHQSFGETSLFEKYSEMVVNFTGVIYPCKNIKHDYQLVPVNVYTPCDMRGPGGVTGMFALESAIDELAEEAGINPLDFRLKNYSEKDHNEDKPFSSKELRKCYQAAADKIGWSKRAKETRATQQDNQLIGYGMATGIWEAMQQKSAAKASVDAQGHLTVSTSTADIGTGTYTVMTQIAAETMGLEMDKVTFKLGDTNLPAAPIEGGSWTVSSVGSAVKAVCKRLKLRFIELGIVANPSLFAEVNVEDVQLKDDCLIINGKDKVSLTELIKETDEENAISITFNEKPAGEREQYSCYAHSCVMVKVAVDEDLGMIKVEQMVSAVAGGRIINPKTARSQIIGGMTWGLSMALEEEGMMDDNLGRIMNSNLAEYHVAIHADIQELDVIFVEEKDEIVNPLGAKGLGEIGMVGVAAAIANAVYHATGKRVRKLPITLDKLM